MRQNRPRRALARHGRELRPRDDDAALEVFDRLLSGAEAQTALRRAEGSLPHRVGLAHTALARAQMTTIRLRLLKIGASVHVSVRRVRIAMSSVFPLQRVFAQALDALQRSYPLRT
jgi:hypothetical protein